MAEHDELIVRQQKRDELEKQGISPYPYRYDYTLTISEVLEKFKEADSQTLEEKKPSVKTPGRIVAKRVMGGASFFHLSNGKERLQIYVKKNAIGPEKYATFKSFDTGDIIGVEGSLFRTQTGELTVLVEDFTFLSKCLLPMPEKFHGLQDKETRYRQRYLDLIMNPEARVVFEKRFKIIRGIRKFFDQRGYFEVETPMLHPIPGGANARPFVTHHNALNMELYLRIAPELYLKRLIVGGFDRVYEINRSFRNEGIDFQHNPEFTMIEFYQAYSDFNDLIKLTEELFLHLQAEGVAPEKVVYDNNEISLTPPFQKVDFIESLSQLGPLTKEDLADPAKVIALAQKKAAEAGAEAIPPVFAKAADYLFDEFVKPKLVQPTFVLNHPVELSPLAKPHREMEGRTERFELFMAGAEVANAFSELNIPEIQLQRFQEQAKNREAGDDEAQFVDMDFVNALQYGLPPTAGEGIGIDRLVMILTGTRSIKDVLLFPLLKLKEE